MLVKITAMPHGTVIGAGAVVQYVKPLVRDTCIPCRKADSSLAVPYPCNLLLVPAGKHQMTVQMLATCYSCSDLDKVLGSWVWPSSALVLWGARKLNQQMK